MLDIMNLAPAINHDSFSIMDLNPQTQRLHSSPFPSSRTIPQLAQRVFPDALFGTPFDPILLWILPGCPLAAPAALLAFSAFFLLSDVAFFSLPFAIASFRAASRASGRCERRSLMSSRGAPTMPRCCFTVRRVRFLESSCRRLEWLADLSNGDGEVELVEMD